MTIARRNVCANRVCEGRGGRRGLAQSAALRSKGGNRTITASNGVP